MHRHYSVLKGDFGFTGHFTRTEATQEIGAVRRQYPCILLSSSWDYIHFSCPVEISDEICILEFTELHVRGDHAFSYEIQKNGVPVYVRTMEPMSGSFCSCFVKLRLTAGDDITIRGNGSEPVRFTDIFLHSDPEGIFAEYEESMEIGLCFPPFSCTDREKDLNLMLQIKKDFEDLKHFTVGIGIEIAFMNLSDAQSAARIGYFLCLAREAGANLIFNFNSWWGGTPYGRDGKGGYFTDTEYHQVIYDPLNGKIALDIPNLWSNTPWYTMNHPHLNMVRKARLDAVMDILKEQVILLRAEKGDAPNIRIFIDNEPTYWSEFAYTPSPECGGDYNEHCISAARKDGVDLIPSGPVTKAQKTWLLHNLCTYMTDLSKAYHVNAEKEYALVATGEVQYGSHTFAENIFTHTMAYSMYPYADDRHFLYEEHVNPWVRLGVECAGFQDERILSYLNGTGRYAQVNAERCCYTDPRFHQQFYAHGAICDIIFNYYYDTDVNQLHQLDKLMDIPASNPVYGSLVMSYCSYSQELTGGRILSMENMEIAPLRERKVLRPASLGKGSVIFSIGSVRDFPNGGWVELTGLVRPLNGSITVLLGTDPAHPSLRMELPERNADYQLLPIRIPLERVLSSCREERLDQALYLILDMESLFYSDWDQMNAIWEIRSVSAFEDHTGSRACPDGSNVSMALPLTLREYRALSRMAAYRADCRRLAEEYGLSAELPEEMAEDMDAYSGSESYKELYGKLSHRISVQKTDTFMIQGKGYLERFRLHVDSGASLITLAISDEKSGTAADFTGTSALIVELKGIPGGSLFLRMDRHLLQACRLSANRYTLTFIETPEQVSEKTICLPIEAEPALDRIFTGTFLKYEQNTGQIEVTTHDSAAWNWQPVLQFSCEESVPVTLSASAIAGTLLSHMNVNPYTPEAILRARLDDVPTIASLLPGDAVTLTLQGENVASIAAVRGLARGKVVSVVPLSLSAPMHNAFLTIETALDTQVTFELGMNTHLNYQRAHASNPLLAGELDLELRRNNIVLVSFEPEKAQDRPYRALEITLI